MEKDVKEFSTATEKLIQVDIEKEMVRAFFSILWRCWYQELYLM